MKYLHWKTLNKRLRKLQTSYMLHTVSISLAGNYTYLVDFPSGEHIEFWLWPTENNGTVYYNYNSEIGHIKWEKHIDGRRLAYCIFDALKEKEKLNDDEQRFYRFINRRLQRILAF